MAVVYGIIFILGLVVGAFINVLIYRIPLKKSFVLSDSACALCGSKLSSSELIPILSYLMQRGKCKHSQIRYFGSFLRLCIFNDYPNFGIFYRYRSQNNTEWPRVIRYGRRKSFFCIQLL